MELSMRDLFPARYDFSLTVNGRRAERRADDSHANAAVGPAAASELGTEPTPRARARAAKSRSSMPQPARRMNRVEAES